MSSALESAAYLQICTSGLFIGYSGPSRVSSSVLREETRMRAILEENMASYISLERLINVDFGKKINCRFFKFHKRKLQK